MSNDDYSDPDSYSLANQIGLITVLLYIIYCVFEDFGDFVRTDNATNNNTNNTNANTNSNHNNNSHPRYDSLVIRIGLFTTLLVILWTVFQDFRDLARGFLRETFGLDF